MEVNPIEVQEHLKGVSHPVSKDDVVATAERNGAPEDVLEQLRTMDEEQFDGPSAVQAALK